MAVYSVSQLTRYLRDVLEHEVLLQDVWVRGEVGDLRRPASGHSYFNLRDGTAALRCVMFRDGFGADLLESGSSLIAHGRVTLYEPRGDLQLVADVVRPEGMGDLQLRLEQLKLKLQRQGLFEDSRKRPLPRFPQRIGVATSPSGAVWHDIQIVVRRRYPLVELVLAPTPVQGDWAAQGIVDSMNALNRIDGLDAIILARGGGSLEDLWPFNEEGVARAIFASRAPVVTGVGHETDVTIADMVADRRAPTPSAAAEMVVPDVSELRAALETRRRAASQSLLNRMQALRAHVSYLRDRARRRRPDVDSLRQQVDDMLSGVAAKLHRDFHNRQRLTLSLQKRLQALSPQDTLRRGFAIVQARPGGEVVTDPGRLARGDRVEVTLARGGFSADVASTRPNPGKAASDAGRTPSGGTP